MTDQIVINQQLVFELISSAHADELYFLVEANRGYLRQWLPWLDTTRSVADIERFIATAETQYKNGAGPQFVICAGEDKKICGVAGFHKIDKVNRSGAIGYWLAEDYQGRGFIMAACRVLLKLGFADYQINKIEIRCAVGNHKSRAIPERLGFKFEAKLRDSEWLYDHYVDHAVYSLLRGEYDADNA